MHCNWRIEHNNPLLSHTLLFILLALGMERCSCAVIAHRGYSARFPENTLEALEAAVPHAQGIEFDIHCTKDNYLILHHDDTWDRMTLNGSGLIAESNWIGYGEQLKTRRKKDDPKPEPPVTLLETVLVFLEELSARLSEPGNEANSHGSKQPFIVIIDVKEDQPIAVLGLLAEQLRRHPTLLSSSSIKLHVGVWTEQFWQEAVRVLPAECSRTWINEGPEIGHCGKDVDSYDIELNALSLRQIRTLRQQSAPSAQIFVWTCNTAQQVQVAKALGVDGILSDDPVQAASDWL
jgi:glycerophosphoryl diester phosphodiesterase